MGPFSMRIIILTNPLLLLWQTASSMNVTGAQAEKAGSVTPAPKKAKYDGNVASKWLFRACLLGPDNMF